MMTETGPCLVEVNVRCHGARGVWMPVARAFAGYTPGGVDGSRARSLVGMGQNYQPQYKGVGAIWISRHIQDRSGSSRLETMVNPQLSEFMIVLLKR